jgi:Spy/CpxP family protein refolding chaperone
MDIFTQKKLLVRIVIVLALLNMICIGLFMLKVVVPSHRPVEVAPAEVHDVSAILQKELKLSREQVDQIRNLRAEFTEKEKKLVEAIKSERDSMNQEMFNKSTREDVVRSIAQKIADNEFRMEMLRYDQASKLKSICSPDQVEKFEKLVIEMRDFFKPENNKPARQPRKGPPRKDEKKPDF